MTNEELRKLPPLERLLYFVNERWQILKRREAGKPKPWSDNPLMQSTYFTNIRREDDRVTKWYAANIREPLKDDPTVIFATIMFRWFNYIPTGEVLVGEDYHLDWDLNRVVFRLNRIKAEGKQVFTGAYNISNSGSTKPKINRVCEDYIQPVWERRNGILNFLAAHPNCSLQNMFTKLSEFPGLGGSGFCAAQVIADLKYTSFLQGAPDWWDWCVLGPGSKKGINILLGRPVEGPPPKDALKEVNKFREIIAKRLPKIPPLHAQDMQNCFCELSKFNRVLDGGRSKRVYHGA